MKKYDFGGYATKNDLKCGDGRTIRKDAFKDCDGMIVPLVWGHTHNDPFSVLGHALLQNREDGVYTYGYFNDSDAGKQGRELVHNGDVKALSIYANNLVQRGGDVIHGMIREVSLVLAGANPGAVIDDLSLEHSWDEDYDDGEAIIMNGFNLEEHIEHADEESKKETKEEPKEESKIDNNKTLGDIFKTLNEEQKVLIYAMIQEAVENTLTNKDEEETKMKHNLFDTDKESRTDVISHSDMAAVFGDAKRLGSLKDSVEHHLADGVLTNYIQHDVYDSNGNKVTYGVADIDYLFPDYKNIQNTPEFIRREGDWVNAVMNGVHKSPFSRIKSMAANITMDEARAKGYVKGNRKTEEVFSLLKRTTDPQTIYKKQKLDRDDVIDITDFDVVAWIKAEMRMMLDEEIARAILIGDGRLTSDDDKIFEAHVRPILTDDELYSIKVPVTAGGTNDATAKNIIRSILLHRKYYKGSGSLVYFVGEDWLNEMLLLEDGFGHSLYPDVAALARKLRVNRIVAVPQMDNFTISQGVTLGGILVDLRDYNVGADKGGAVAMFDDFDIDYNQMKYLIETRISGALTKPYSAMVVEIGGTATVYSAVTPENGDNPKTSGWFEKQGDLYVPTADTTVKNGKTYYSKS